MIATSPRIVRAAVLVVAAMLWPALAAAENRAPVKSLKEIRRGNVVTQEWDLSCGAAALTTLLNIQHGDPVTEKEVARGLIKRQEYIDQPELVRIREGFSLLDLKRYVDQRGYDGIGYGKLEVENLTELAPILVPINTVGYNHFVIFRGMAGNRVLLADPAWGNRTMTIERFERSWIDYGPIGRVGFVVTGPAGLAAPGGLAPVLSDFVTFN
jgi:predicted double-glycine peptidase